MSKPKPQAMTSYKRALLNEDPKQQKPVSVSGNPLQGGQAGAVSVSRNPLQGRQEGTVSVSENPDLQKLIRELQENHPEQTLDQIQAKFDEAEGLYSKASQLDKEIEEMEKRLEALKAKSKSLKKNGDNSTICAYLEKTDSEKLHHTLSRWVFDILHHEFGIPDYHQVIMLYELMLLHYPENRDEALLQLALIYLKGKIDNQNRGKEHRRQVLSNPEKAQSYAQLIEDPQLRRCFQIKSEKYLAKRK